MKKLNYLYIVIVFLIFESLRAEANNFEAGKNFFEKKNYDLAKLKFEQDIVFNPKNENSYLYLAKIYNFQKNDNQEEQNLKTVILLNPKNEEAIFNLGLLKIRKSNYDEAKKLIETFKKVCNNSCNQLVTLQKKLDTILQK